MAGNDCGWGDIDVMSVENLPAAANRSKTVFDAIFANVPPLGSPEYLKLLETARLAELPAQVLVKAFRQLVTAGSLDAANATLVRLFGDLRFDYIGIVRKLASSYEPKGNFSYDPEDLVQETIKEIVRTLPTDRGAMAEGAWVTFIQQRFADAWRNLYGRDGKKDSEGRVGVYTDPKTGTEHDPVEETDASEADWHTQLREDAAPWLAEFMERAVEMIEDPLIRYVMKDQLSDDPSPISAGKSEGGKPPLTEQLGVNRFKIRRAIMSGRSRLAAELLKQREKDIDMEWLRKFAD